MLPNRRTFDVASKNTILLLCNFIKLYEILILKSQKCVDLNISVISSRSHFSDAMDFLRIFQKKSTFFLEHIVPPPWNIKKDRKPPQGEVVKKINIISVGFCPGGPNIARQLS